MPASIDNAQSQAIRLFGSLRERNVGSLSKSRDLLASESDPGYPNAFLWRILAGNRRASVTVALLYLYGGHKLKAVMRGSIFCRTLRELPAEGGREVRRASESAGQSYI
jgi:hypothetical protein